MIGGVAGSAAEAAAELLPTGVSIAPRSPIGRGVVGGRRAVDLRRAGLQRRRKRQEGDVELAVKIPESPLNGGKLENARIVESITAC